MADGPPTEASPDKDSEVLSIREFNADNPMPEPETDEDQKTGELYEDQKISDEDKETEPNGDQATDPVEENDGTPRVGMSFKNFEEVYEFYNQYARSIGFGTKIRRSWYSLEDGQCNKVMLTCCKEGKRVYKNSERSTYRMRLSARTDCQARVKVQKKYSDGLLYLVEVNLEHNHPVNPSMSRYFRSHKEMNDGTKKQLSVRAKGHRDVGAGDKENEDSSGKSRSCFLGKEDIEALQHFFIRMQATNSNFFYLTDLDSEGCLRNVFWGDGRSKVEYQYFGDVIAFDTTYLTDNYETPLALFVGVNHHGHSVLLGCGLLSDRTTETYRCLFKMWLSCMSENPPHAIVTDHCNEIKEAVAEAFPGVRHRLSLWHIMRRLQENLGGHTEYKAIKGMIKKAVYDSLTVDEFEGDWKSMIEKHGLEDNEWLKSLYENRNFWVPVYVESSFWAGICSIQHKDARNCIFDGYLYPKTSIKQFLNKYESAMHSNFEKEVQADIDSFQKSPQLISKLYMEEQVRKIYTVDMFKKFQEEVKAILYCIPALLREEGPVSIFEVKECIRVNDGKEVQNKNYEVTYNASDLDVQCICCSFQSRGILCRHTLSVLNFLEIYEIPSQYVIERWRKDFKQQHALASSSDDVVTSGPMERYDNLYKCCLKFLEVGAMSEDKYEYAFKTIRDLTEELLVGDCTTRDIQRKTVAGDAQENCGLVGSTVNYKANVNDANDEIHDLMQVRRRGRPPKKRKESLAEKIVESSRRKVCQRKQIMGSQNDVLHIAQNTPHFDAHIWTHDSISLPEQVSPTNLTIGNHFGVQMNHQHTMDNQSGMRWSFQQMFQHPHTPDGPPGPWAG